MFLNLSIIAVLLNKVSIACLTLCGTTVAFFIMLFMLVLGA